MHTDAIAVVGYKFCVPDGCQERMHDGALLNLHSNLFKKNTHTQRDLFCLSTVAHLHQTAAALQLIQFCAENGYLVPSAHPISPYCI